MVPTLMLILALSAPADIDAAARQLAFQGVVRLEREGKLLFEKGYGTPPATAFWVASISKSFTAALVLRLVELKRLRLEDRIERFLPAVPPDKGSITIDQLLTHTSGLPGATYQADGVVDPAEAARRILALPRSDSGSFAYTNDGYALLAIVVERAGGAPFEELLRREIIARAPLAATGSWPGCVRGVRLAPLAQPPTGSRARSNWGSKGGEGVCSTAEDLARFVWALAEGRLVSPASRDLLWAGAVPLSSGSAGRGFFSSTTRSGETVIWTRGTEDQGHNGMVKWFPRSRTVVVVLSHVPERRRDVPAPSRALGDAIEDLLPALGNSR